MTAGVASPTVRQRRLAAELKRLRLDSGKKMADAAEVLGCAASKISRIENGVTGVHWRDARDLVLYYGGSAAKVAELVALAHDARQTGWWHAYGDSLREKYSIYIGLEQAAVTAQTFEPSLIPGLLQTEDYAMAVMEAAMVAPESRADRVEVRRKRQEVLTRVESPLRLHAIVDEAVLRRPFGSEVAMREQLSHLTNIAALPNVTVQVLPFASGGHPGTAGPFVILDLPAGDNPVVFLEHIRNDLYLEKASDIDEYRMMFRRMSGIALDVGRSVSFIKQLLKEFT